jgi:GNAT superfamily N-acetyltransferase
MSDYLIHPLKETQQEEALNLMRRIFEPSLHSIFFLHPQTTLVVTFEGKIVGGLNLDVYQVNAKIKMGYLGWLYIDEQHRGKGLAGRLIDEGLTFLREIGCTDAAGCVEGDNPASFRQLEQRGFAIRSLSFQLKRYRLGMLKVWSHASRFFDMGYFFWQVSLKEAHPISYPTNLHAFLRTALGNTLAFTLLVFGWNIPSWFSLPWAQASAPENLMFLFLIPSLTLSLRSLSMLLVARAYRLPVVYRGWDTAYLAAYLAPLLLGLPFPNPGNIYIKGSSWSPASQAKPLFAMGLASVCSLALLALLIPHPYVVILLILDTFFFPYPFCGFNASRMWKGKRALAILPTLITLVCCTLLLIY